MTRPTRLAAVTALVAYSLLGLIAAQADDAKTEPAGSGDATRTVTFAGGCFWCLEPPFDELDGVLATTAGYTGGKLQNPTYKQVSSGRTGHIEALQISYDPKRISYEKLLNVLWRNIDPTQKGGQFCDEGSQYRSAIFFANERERELAEQSKKTVAELLGKRVVTEILPAEKFWPAEDYHQDYYIKNPLRYKYYRYTCGRDQRLQVVWGDKVLK